VEGGGDKEEEEPEEDAGQEGAARGDGGGGGHGGMGTPCAVMRRILSDSCPHASEPYENESARSFVCGGMVRDGCEFDKEITSPACRCSSVVSVAPMSAVRLGIGISWGGCGGGLGTFTEHANMGGSLRFLPRVGKGIQLISRAWYPLHPMFPTERHERKLACAGPRACRHFVNSIFLQTASAYRTYANRSWGWAPGGGGGGGAGVDVHGEGRGKGGGDGDAQEGGGRATGAGPGGREEGWSDRWVRCIAA